MSLILVAVISLGAIGLISAVILYVASKKFAVYEDPRIGQVAQVLPQANCGGCGFPGCSGFAAACESRFSGRKNVSGGRSAYNGESCKHLGAGGGCFRTEGGSGKM